MIHRIKIKYIVTFCLISLFTLEANVEKFKFYKAYPTCNDIIGEENIYAYTQEQANKKFNQKILEVNVKQCKETKHIFSNDDIEYQKELNLIGITNKELKHFYSNCIRKKLGIHKDNLVSVSCKTSYEWPFNRVYIINNKFLIIDLDSFYFVFKKILNTNILLKDLKKIKNIELNIQKLQELLYRTPLTPQTLTQYNNIAYYLQKAGANEEAVYLLEKIIKKFPNRTVAYYNIGDAYWALGEKEKAKKAYTTYIEQMCNKGLQKKIPKEVLKRVERKDVCK